MTLDFISNNANEILIQNGDFVIDESTLFHAKDIINSQMGEYKQYPLLGTGINSYIGSSINQLILSNIIKNDLIKDNITLLEYDIITDSNNITFNIKVK